MSKSFHVQCPTFGLSVESEWQQVPKQVQDSSQYSGRSQLNAVVWMFLFCSQFSSSSCPLFKPFGAVISAPIINGITVTLMFHSFLRSLARSKYLSLFSVSFIVTVWSGGMPNLLYSGFSFSFFIYFFYFF